MIQGAQAVVGYCAYLHLGSAQVCTARIVTRIGSNCTLRRPLKHLHIWTSSAGVNSTVINKNAIVSAVTDRR